MLFSDFGVESDSSDVKVRRRLDLFIESVVEAAKLLSNDLIHIINNGGSDSKTQNPTKEVPKIARVSNKGNCSGLQEEQKINKIYSQKEMPASPLKSMGDDNFVVKREVVNNPNCLLYTSPSPRDS